METGNSSELWYYVIDNKPEGPVSVATIRTLIEQNKILPETLVCRVGESVWYAAKEYNVLGARAHETLRTLLSDSPKSIPPESQPAPPVLAKAVNVPVAEFQSLENKILSKEAKAKEFARAFWLFVGTSLLTSILIYVLLIRHNYLILLNLGSLIMMHFEYLSVAEGAVANPHALLLKFLLLAQLGLVVNLTRQYREDSWRWTGMAILVIFVFGLLGCMAIASDAWRRLTILRGQRDAGYFNWAGISCLLVGVMALLCPLTVSAIQAPRNAPTKNAQHQSAADSTSAALPESRSYFFDRTLSIEIPAEWQEVPEYNAKAGLLAYQNPKTGCGLFIFRDLIPDSNIANFAGWADQKHAAGATPIKLPLPEWQVRNLGKMKTLFREYTIAMLDSPGFFTLRSYLVDQAPTFTHILVVLPTAVAPSERSVIEKILNSITFH